MSNSPLSTRRDFLRRTTGVTAASAFAGMSVPFVHAAEDNAVGVALVGCGGRGTGAAAQALNVVSLPTKLVAMADVFGGKPDASLKNIQGEINGAADELRGVAVCVVELPTMLPIACIQPRRFKQVAVGPVVTTGDRAFDDAYLVTGQPQLDSPSVLTPAVTQRIASRDDWVFRAHRAWLACVSLGPFRSADEMVQRIDQVLGIVAAFPASVVPTAIDHSADDLIERAAKLQTFDEALVFLQGLTDAERARLRSSDSPLAVMADVRTPAEAMERIKSLDQEQKLQLYAPVQRVKR